MAELKSMRDDFTKTLSLLRKEVKVATNILEDNDEIKRNMKAEKAMQQKRFIIKQKTLMKKTSQILKEKNIYMDM